MAILPYQLYRRPLSGALTSKMITHACREPETNRQAIMGEGILCMGIGDDIEDLPAVLVSIFARLSKCVKAADSEQRAANIEVYSSMTKVPARQIGAPTLRFTADMEPNKITKGIWKLDDQKFLNTALTFNGTTHFIIPTDGRMLPRNDREDYLRHFFNHVGRNGVQGSGTFNGLTAQNCTDLSNMSAANINAAVKIASDRGAGLMVLILPVNDKQHLLHYAHFKTATDVHFGIKSLCLCEDKIKKSLFGRSQQALQSVPANIGTGHPYAGYVRNVGMKLNLRLGNTNHSIAKKDLRDNKLDPDGELDFMILGADVTTSLWRTA